MLKVEQNLVTHFLFIGTCRDRGYIVPDDVYEVTISGAIFPSFSIGVAFQ